MPPTVPRTMAVSPLPSRTQRIEAKLNAIFEPLDVIGKKLMGDLWRTFYLSIQDAIALACLLQIPGFIGKIIIGKSFSGFDVCLIESGWSINRYACFIIVSSDFLLWIILAGRIVGRFLHDLKELFSSTKKQGKA